MSVIFIQKKNKNELLFVTFCLDHEKTKENATNILLCGEIFVKTDLIGTSLSSELTFCLGFIPFA